VALSESHVDTTAFSVSTRDRARASEGRRWSAASLLTLPGVLLVVVVFLVPLAVVVLYSFRPTVAGQIADTLTIGNYVRVFTESVYLNSLLQTFLTVGAASALTVALAFPAAYFVATKAQPRRRLIWLLAIVLPYLTSYLIRVLAWMTLFGSTGLINRTLMDLGLISAPIPAFQAGVVPIAITLAYLLFPVAFLTCYISLDRIPSTMNEAGADLGAGRLRRFLHVTLPLSKGGIAGAFILCFIAMLGDYLTPAMVGGSAGVMYANVITNQFGASLEWGFGSALAVVMLVSILLLMAILRTATGKSQIPSTGDPAFVPRRAPLLRAYAIVMLVFMYLPMAILITFAFNDSSNVGLPFTGFTFRWFQSVFENYSLQYALTTTLQVAGVSVAISLVLGTAAALYIARHRTVWGTASLTTLVMPLVLPPVILGIGILVVMNALGVERGLWTIILGHTVLILPMVTLVMVIRLESVDPNYELAAQDLGAKPVTVFVRVVLPQIVPGLIAAALIAAATSLDEFILTFLITGTDVTLPLYIFGSLRLGVSPDVTALATLMLAVSIGFVLIAAVVVFGRSRAANSLTRGGH
jgi:spermidine/putrescine transport system permease protein